MYLGDSALLARGVFSLPRGGILASSGRHVGFRISKKSGSGLLSCELV